MWLHYNGLDHKVLNPIHIKRMKEDGAVEIEDPTAQVVSQAPEQTATEPLETSESENGPEQPTEPLESVDGSTEQQSQDEPHVGDPGETVETDSKKSKRSTKA